MLFSAWHSFMNSLILRNYPNNLSKLHGLKIDIFIFLVYLITERVFLKTQQNPNSMNPGESKEIAMGTLSLRTEDNLFNVKVTKPITVDIPHVIEIKDILRKIRDEGNPDIYVIIELGKVKGFTKDARAHVSNETDEPAKALALVASSAISRIIGNFLIGLNKPPIPVKIFTDKDKAIQWLKNLR